MPLFELFRLAKGKLDSAQEKLTPCSTDSSAEPESGFGGLAWENGQVGMQSQCSPRDKKSLSLNTPSLTTKLGGEDNVRAGKIGNLGFELSEFPESVPSAEISLNQDDDMVPWLGYPISGSLHSDYSSDFLPELPGVAVNETSARNNFGSVAKTGNGQLCRDSFFTSLQNGNGLEGGTRTRTSNMQLFSSSLPLQSQLSGSCLKLQTADSGPSINTSSAMNFSYFARPTVIVKSNNESKHKMGSLGLSGMEQAGNRDMDAAVDTTNTSNSKPVVSRSCLGKRVGPSNQSAVPRQRVGPKLSESKSYKVPVSARKNEAVILEDNLKGKEDKFSNQSQRPCGTKGGLADGEKTLEPLGGTSSVCSGNSVERASDDLKHGLKRKSHETEESEGHSEDVGDEMVSANKQTTARHTPSRRSRAAEVHNLSERRRRDRINEKMRVLQELIPNCNKVDKASMLDEAIEYCKNLKLQLQMMTMGGGFYVPPMILPTGLQPMGHIPFPNMGMGMGRDLEFGIGMPHMTMQGAHFPGPLMSGLHGMAGSNLHMYGVHGQGLPLPMPRAPLVPFLGGPVMKSATGLSKACGMPGTVEKDPATVSSGKESVQSISKQSPQNTDSSYLTKQHLSSQPMVVSSSGQGSDKKNARGFADPASRSIPRPKTTGL
ncbi:transcription factor PIF3-like [Punica granatum]|uniref:Transcription factor PIF3-like n=1 Tax=Punica granatum TaxID=22663 RepID=A0A218WHR0_PUNGR|nr:transcription factor PIF3-like [Punica granatum]OWM72374.1 hypothetical protein CDL15_Pgr018259 [Punica granatum]